MIRNSLGYFFLLCELLCIVTVNKVSINKVTCLLRQNKQNCVCVCCVCVCCVCVLCVCVVCVCCVCVFQSVICVFTTVCTCVWQSG